MPEARASFGGMLLISETRRLAIRQLNSVIQKTPAGLKPIICSRKPLAQKDAYKGVH
jgi:hypothetical protein